MSDDLIETTIVISTADNTEILAISINRQHFEDIDEQELLDEILPDLADVIDEPFNVDIYQRRKNKMH